MKRLLLILALLSSCAMAQQGNTVTIPFVGVPAGTCGPLMLGLNQSNGDLYDCPAGSWVKTGTGGGGGAVSSVTGDGTVITNAASVGAVTLTIAGTSGGVPFFNSTTGWASSALLAANAPVLGGGAGTAPKTSTGITSNGASELDLGLNGTASGVLGLKGSTSGTSTFTAPAVAGTSTNQVVSSNVLGGPDGAVGTPTYGFSGVANLGWYRSGNSIVGTSQGVNSFKTFTVTSAGFNLTGANGSWGWSSTNDTTGNMDTSVGRLAAGIVEVGSGTSAARNGFLLSGNSVFVTTNFTTANNTNLQTITGLSWTFPAAAANWSYHCHLSYQQGTANVAVAFGIQAATNNPTNIFSQGTMQLSTTAGTSTYASGTLATLATTTATTIVSGTPLATATNYVADLNGTFELAASANTINIMVSTATGTDAVTILRGSYCSLTP